MTSAIHPPLSPALSALLPTALLQQSRPAQFAAGDCLFLTGQRPQWMFYVLAGEVVLERHGLQGQVACLQRSTAGFVGEASLTSARYHCDGRSTAPTWVSRVPIAPLRAALQQDSAFAMRWLSMLSSEVRRLRLQNERLSLPKIEERVLHLIETEGLQGLYTLTGSLKNLAKTLGVAHEALYRTLARLEAEGRVTRHSNGLELT